MAHNPVLVSHAFAYPSGRPASRVPIQVVVRGTGEVIRTMLTDDGGKINLYLLPGSYDLRTSGMIVPVDVEAVDHDLDAALLAHISDPTPHPVHDDGPSFVLLFENGLI